MIQHSLTGGRRFGSEKRRLVGSVSDYVRLTGRHLVVTDPKANAMMRRELIKLIAGSAVSLPLAARAQQPARLPTIGFLGAVTPAVAGPWVQAFIKRLEELGWIEGRTVAIEYRWAEARTERYAEIAAEFVRLKVDVIVTWSGVPVLTARQATKSIPIVFAAQTDPVGIGLVQSLPRPGGNVTGISLQQADTASKRLELLREVVPNFGRLAIMANVGGPGAVLERTDVQATARALGLETTNVDIRQPEDIAPAIEALKGHADALYVATDPVVFSQRARINTLAQTARLPTVYGSREYVETGGLLSYGANWPGLFRRTADLVSKILRGAKPEDIPVEQATKFDLVVNLTTARNLGLTIPETFLLRADEVIE